MGIMFEGWWRDQLESEELSSLVERAQALSKDDYELLKRNYKQLSELTNRILKLSKKENEWKLYFDAMYYMLFLQRHNDNYVEIVKYAELFYKEYDLHMEEELPKYRGTDMDVNNVYIYDLIFDTYSGYAQIDDAKMEAFMQRYEEVVLKYGKAYIYYDSEMQIARLYHDAGRARAAAKNYLKHIKECASCYICSHKMYLHQLLQTGQDQEAERLMLKLVNKDIPKEHIWCYEHCESAEPVRLYELVLEACIWEGKTEAFWYFYEKYWKTQPVEARKKGMGLFKALDSYFEELTPDLQDIEEKLRREKTETTLGNIEKFLEWWCYFTLLEKGGVHEVMIQIPDVTDASGQADTLAAARYMEDKADTYGEMFSRARAQFDYAYTKEAYRKCLLSDRTVRH